jgi:hypothetical protein
LPEALTVSLMIDLLCPVSNWHRTISELAAPPADGGPGR